MEVDYYPKLPTKRRELSDQTKELVQLNFVPEKDKRARPLPLLHNDNTLIVQAKQTGGQKAKSLHVCNLETGKASYKLYNAELLIAIKG